MKIKLGKKCKILKLCKNQIYCDRFKMLGIFLIGHSIRLFKITIFKVEDILLDIFI